MKSFNKLTGIIASMPQVNIDTDAIIPKQFLKTIERTGLGKHLFHEKRYDQNNILNNSFVLNKKPWNKAKMIVAGDNFGCGSSREHAAWAIKDYGFDIVISSFFADIFKMNALNNNILPIQLNDKILKHLFELIYKNPSIRFKIDLPSQTVGINKELIHFEVDNYKKMCLINGYDDIDYLISKKKLIKNFINQR